MDELRELYQEVILDHGKRPRNLRALSDATCQAHGRNPLCGDQLTVYLKVGHNGLVEDASFVGKGCAISVASASLMTEAVRGKTTAEAEALSEQVHELLTRADAPSGAALGKLAALSGVREFPARVKCASLCWHTLRAALADAAAPVSTE